MSKKVKDKKIDNRKLPNNINPKFANKKPKKLLEKDIESKMHTNDRKHNISNQNKQPFKKKLVNKKKSKENGFVQKALDRVFGKASSNKRDQKKNPKNTYH